MCAAIQALLDGGFLPDGQTTQTTARISTRQSPVYGASGGEIATFGGRQRFAKQGTVIKATVGKRTTAIYRHEGQKIKAIATVSTADTGAIRDALRGMDSLDPTT